MPSPFERLTEMAEERRRRSAANWVENELREAEGAVRDKWKRMADLRDSRNHLRDNYTDTAADLGTWQEQREEIQQVIQEEKRATAHWRKTAHDLSRGVSPLKLRLKGTSSAQVLQVIASRSAQFGNDLRDIRDAIDPLVNEEPPSVLPQYSPLAPQQSASAAQAHLAAAALDALPSATQGRDSTPSAPPPPYSPSPHSPTPSVTPAFQGPRALQGPEPRPRSR
ncbi:hypothetical protein GCM10009863_63300 [Streptomyces axinellae]|uniref:Uncharacterized protein n=1 Tax=Streptomyces axinellae TaxID=552788 RepID=A0ABP6DEI6_9ACTN